MRIAPVNTNNYNNSFDNNSYQPAFNGRLTEAYGKWVLKSKRVKNFAKKMYEKDTTNATKHFAVVGAFVTSAAYAYNTMKNNKLEKKNSTTLAINQSLGWIVPTVLGYLIDAGIADRTKNVEYNFAAKLTKALKMSKDLTVDHEVLEKVAKQIKGVKTLASIATFVLLYRYLAPVLITPVANHIGDWVGKKVDEKNAAKKQKQLQQQEIKAATA